jgi:signal transduction histidine kinase
MYSTINFIFTHNQDDYDIPEDLKINIYRILQEQITNIIKHAKADTATINLVQTGYQLKFEVSDNGVGFDSQKITDGIGLTNIKTRVSTFNGNIHIQSSKNNGCRIEIEFALP